MNLFLHAKCKFIFNRLEEFVVWCVPYSITVYNTPSLITKWQSSQSVGDISM